MRSIALLCLSVLLSLGAPVQAQSKDPLKVFFFGNSLLHHLSDSPETSMPYWLGQIARADGNSLRASGKWGFLRELASALPPDPNWTIKDVKSAWGPSQGSLAEGGVQAVVMNPTNFIQYNAPDVPLEGDNPDQVSPVSAALKVFDWSSVGATQMRLFIYEGWAELAAYDSRFPPRARKYRKFLKANQGDYHDWYVDYVAALNAARPDFNVTLIPVASTLPDILALPGLEDLEATDLFTDDAPHGTATMYFLAALISYAPLFQDAPPAAMDLPDSIHPLVRQHYPRIVELISQQQASLQRPPDPPVRALPTPLKPALAMGLNGISDWTTQYPFLDVMKTARPWIGHMTGRWGGWDDDQLTRAGHLDEHGWPLSLPEGVDRLESFILTDLPEEARYFAGRYRLTYTGQGQLELVGRAEEVEANPGEIWFTFEPGDGLVAISISALDPEDPIRNIQVVQEAHLPLLELGETFNPDWLALIEDLRVLRFMDWMQTNGSPVETWQDRPRRSDYTYAWRGVPLEVMLDLVNQVGADPWFNMPHRADDEFMRRFAEGVKRDLDPGLKAYVEFSNELWNFLFPQAQYARQQAADRWKGVGDDGWMQWSGMRAAQMAAIWQEVFGPEAEQRLTRVIATHTGWPGLEEALLEAPRWQKESKDNPAPVTRFDAYAITGYFGHDLGADRAPEVLEWLQISESEARKESYKALQTGDVKELVEELFPYHGKVAAKHGLDLIMYEGGTHVVGHGKWVTDPALTAFFNSFNYSPEMAALYSEVLEGWQAAGGTLFNAFVDVAKPSQWGSWGALRHLQDDNPRWAMLMAYNARLPQDWEGRNATVFRRGQVRLGDGEANTIEGSPFADVLLGADGDDWLVSLGGPDLLDGGPGTDTAVLPGAPADYLLTWSGADLMADGPEDGELRMRSVEQLEFESDPGQIYAVSPPR